jgi:hypothetical protein
VLAAEGGAGGGEVGGCALEHDPAAVVAGARAAVDDPVGVRHDRPVVRDIDDRLARVDEPAQQRQQLLHVGECRPVIGSSRTSAPGTSTSVNAATWPTPRSTNLRHRAGQQLEDQQQTVARVLRLEGHVVPTPALRSTWSGPPLMPRTGKDRLRFDIAPPVDGDQQTEVNRLVSLGAARIEIGQDEVSWVAMADPHGNEFRVLTPR